MNKIKENNKYKDSVFVDIFMNDVDSKERLLSIYNALYHKNYKLNEVKLETFKVDSTLYLNFRNDVSFTINDKLIMFFEHQSTINKNMPLRMLMYLGRAYEKIVPTKDRYKRELVKILTPEFYVFYNGKAELPKEEILKLSDSFKMNEEKIFLELKVRVININLNKKHKIIQECNILNEYMKFVSKVEEFKSKNINNPIKEAIKYCIEHNILSEYLKKNGSEVENMLMAEYDYETDITVQREEAEEKRKIKDAKILMDFCNDDEVISKKMELDLEKVKELRKEWKKDKK